MANYQRFALHETLTTKPGTEAGDGSLLRPFIVFFGESVPMIEPAAEAVQQADIFVIIGTSLNVYPAAGLISYTKPHIPIYLIDPGAVNTNGYYKIEHIMKGASDGMKELKEILEKQQKQTGKHPLKLPRLLLLL